MYAFDITKTQHSFTFRNGAKNPSFSSTLLDNIYRSIDEGERNTNDINFHNQTMGKKQSRVVEEELTAASIRRACLLEKVKTQMERKSRWRNHDNDKEVMFFSSTSSSSDSSYGLLSSPDTESLYGMKSKPRVSCFAPSRSKPVMTSASNEDGNLIKSKSRALKIYNNLKKVKQPISPGGKLSSFLNSLFATGNAKKTKTYDDAKAKSVQDSTCSSASSFSRSCLSKASPSSNKLRDGVKRTVRFYPVSVIVDEDSRPCGHKCLYEEDTRVMAVSVPTAWKIGRKNNEEEEEKVVDKSRRVEEVAREFLKEYHRSQKKSDLILSDFPNVDEEDDDDDDAASYSSSDLFELDHLAVIGNNRYHEELPVYETTHVSTNRAIANGLI
ncbi:Protein BIG GRAIN 1-like A, partial [Mucuna pruriens]